MARWGSEKWEAISRVSFLNYSFLVLLKSETKSNLFCHFACKRPGGTGTKILNKPAKEFENKRIPDSYLLP